MLKRIFPPIVISFLLVGCDNLPTAPEVYRCGYFYSDSVEPEFICVSSKDNDKVVIRKPTEMFEAQCLSADDYKLEQEYITHVIEYVKNNCN